MSGAPATGRLDGRVGLVSGAARGIGSAIVRKLVADGASVVLADLDAERAAEVAREFGDRAVAVGLDVREEASWEGAIALAGEAFGGLDVLVNNAGILKPMPLVALSLAEYQATIDVNQTGVFLGMRTAVGPLVARGGGSIVNLSSIEGLVGQPFTLAYVASKFAVRGMTKVAALELAGAGIRVNSVHPGYVDTEMLGPANLGFSYSDVYDPRQVPLGRFAQPGDVADVVCFLASDESRYCTGSEFVVDGGLMAAVPGTTTAG